MRDAELSNELQSVECHFYVRTQASDGKWHYDLMSIKGPQGGGGLHTVHPPEAGDLIPLRDSSGLIPDGTFKVLCRRWIYSAYGSPNWPIGTPESWRAPMLDLIVEPCDGPFENESSLRSPYSDDGKEE